MYQATSNQNEFMLPPSNELAEPKGTLKPHKSYLLHGIAASVILTAAYFAIVSVAESLDHAVTQFISFSYLFIPLIATFGIQIGLFSYARQQSRTMHQRSANAATSGGMSTVSMILCCLHHITDIAAFVGLAAITLFLTTYQPVFMLIGIVSNILGILTNLLFLQKTMLYNPRGMLATPMRLNLAKIRKFALVIGVTAVILGSVFVALSDQPSQQISTSANPFSSDVGGTFNLPQRSVSQNGLSIQATPRPFTFGSPIAISLVLDAHSGALSFDLSQVVLRDGNGVTYAATEWSGSPFGGHHVSGTLSFPRLVSESSSMELDLKNIFGTDWAFEWKLAS